MKEIWTYCNLWIALSILSLAWQVAAKSDVRRRSKQSGTSIPSFSQIYVFGDNISDVGNAHTVANVVERVSNDAVAVEYVADYYGLTIEESGHLVIPPRDPPGNNYAVLLSLTTGKEPDSLSNQVNAFLEANVVAPSDALYMVTSGLWEVFQISESRYLGGWSMEKASEELQKVAQTIGNNVRTLIDAGATNIMVSDPSDLSKVPLATLLNGSDFRPIAQQNNYEIQKLMKAEINTIKCESGIDIMHFTSSNLLHQAGLDAGLNMDAPCTLAFEGISLPDIIYKGDPSNPVYDAECHGTTPTPEAYGMYAHTYGYWDEIHPTSALQEICANMFIDFINTKTSKENFPIMSMKKCDKKKEKKSKDKKKLKLLKLPKKPKVPNRTI